LTFFYYLTAERSFIFHIVGHRKYVEKLKGTRGEGGGAELAAYLSWTLEVDTTIFLVNVFHMDSLLFLFLIALAYFKVS
jgi:hypothetical protein